MDDMPSSIEHGYGSAAVQERLCSRQGGLQVGQHAMDRCIVTAPYAPAPLCARNQHAQKPSPLHQSSPPVAVRSFSHDPYIANLILQIGHSEGQQSPSYAPTA